MLTFGGFGEVGTTLGGMFGCVAAFEDSLAGASFAFVCCLAYGLTSGVRAS